MKFMLISLNVLLVVAIAYLAWKYTSDPVAFPSKTKIAPRSVSEIVGKTASAKSTRKKNSMTVMESPEVTEQRINALVKRNVFNSERVPDAPANKSNARAAQQVRADMSLVGTYTIGDSLGAIILQRLQGNAQQQLKELQQKEYEQYQASATRVTDPKKKAEAAAAAESKDVSDAGEGEDGTDKKVVVMGNAAVSANNVFRQHLKVGDTTVTGYKLVEVTRTSAVLTRNSERIELPLLSPSEAGNIARQRQNNNNNNNARNNNNNNNRNNANNNNNNNRNNNANRNNANNNNARNNNNNRNNNANRNNANNNNANRNNANNDANRNNNRDDFEWF